MPGWLVVSVAVACLLPAALNLARVDLASPDRPIDWVAAFTGTEGQLTEALYRSLAGTFVHGIMQWTAFCTAIFTVILALVHYAIKRDETTPILAMALFTAACMDAFHILAATRLIPAVADNRDLIPFTWALSRLFHGLVVVVGVGLVLLGRQTGRRGAGLPFVGLVGLAYGVTAYGVIRYCATSERLPRTQFPDYWVTRPYDLIPLAVFLFAFVFLCGPFHRRERTVFSHALLMSVVVEIAAQLYLALGSTRLFDHFFNCGVFLKIVAYGVVFAGLVLDYVHTYRLQRRQAEDLTVYAAELVAAKRELEGRASQLVTQSQELRQFTEQLQRSNRELEEFARVASHDLQEPLRKVRAFGDRLQTKFGDALPDQGRDYVQRMQNATARMQDLINDLLTFSRVTTRARAFEAVDLSEVVRRVVSDLEVRIEETGGRVEVGELPTVEADPMQMRQLFQNLIGNALKYHTPDRPPLVRVGADRVDGERWKITVSDNGIGFDMKHVHKIFEVFQRLHGRDQYEGTGVGLAVCRKIVERHQGTIEAQSVVHRGSVFTVTLPARQSQTQEAFTCRA